MTAVRPRRDRVLEQELVLGDDEAEAERGGAYPQSPPRLVGGAQTHEPRVRGAPIGTKRALHSQAPGAH